MMKTISMTFLGLLFTSSLLADTRNGNDFALYFSEAKNRQEQSDLFNDAQGNPHYFRYLQIMEIDESNPRAVAVTALEPSSLFDVEFIVTKRHSLAKLLEDPRSQLGNAIAITGVVKGVKDKTITVSPVIVRHKDTLTPSRGKEMFYEIDASGAFYSYTGGKRPVTLTFQDRDLLHFRDEIMQSKGKEGWAEFLEQKVAERKKEREAKAKEYKAQVKQDQADENAKKPESSPK
jgi:hypothetical protein